MSENEKRNEMKREVFSKVFYSSSKTWTIFGKIFAKFFSSPKTITKQKFVIIIPRMNETHVQRK